MLRYDVLVNCYNRTEVLPNVLAHNIEEAIDLVANYQAVSRIHIQAFEVQSND